jgi:hypothetical protein
MKSDGDPILSPTQKSRIYTNDYVASDFLADSLLPRCKNVFYKIWCFQFYFICQQFSVRGIDWADWCRTVNLTENRISIQFACKLDRELDAKTYV